MNATLPEKLDAIAAQHGLGRILLTWADADLGAWVGQTTLDRFVFVRYSAGEVEGWFE